MNQKQVPARLAPGQCVDIVNGVLDGGTIVSRPPVLGLWAAAVAGGGSLYEPAEFRRDDGTTEIVAGASGNNKLYYWVLDSGTAPALVTMDSSGTYTVLAAGLRWARHGKYLYGCDGSGELFRYLGSGVAERVLSLDAPANAPGVSLTSSALEPCDDATDWSGFGAFDDSELLSNGDFENVADYNGNFYETIDDWTVVDGQPSAHASNAVVDPYSGSIDLQLDRAVDELRQSVTAPTVSTPFGTLPCLVYEFSGFFHNADANGRASAIVEIGLEDSGGTLLAVQRFEVIQPYEPVDGRWTRQVFVASFTDFLLTPAADLVAQVDKVRLTLRGGAANNPTPDLHGMWIDAVSLKAVSILPEFASAGPNSIALSVSALVGGIDDRATAGWAIGGMTAYKVYGADQDWTGVGTVAVTLAWSPEALTETGNVPRLRLGIQTNAGTVEWSNVLDYDADVSHGFVDITTITAATRAAVRRVYLQVYPGDDLTQDATPPQKLLSFGPIDNSGRLSIGFSDYSYLFVEAKSVGGGKYVLSSGSSYSAIITPTNKQAQGLVDLDANGALPTNPETTHYFIYRTGGVFTDRFPYARQLAVVAIGADSTGNGWEWDASEARFTDNIPDSALVFADIYEVNRDPFPAGITCLAVAHGRLFAAIGNTVYASWLLSETAGEAGLYTSLVSQSDDPSQPIKGETFNIAGGDADKIVSLVPLATGIVLFRGSSLAILNGYEPGNFAVTSVARSSGLGALAARSPIVDADGQSLAYVSSVGVTSFDLDIPRPASDELDPLLIPSGNDGGAVIAATAFAGIVQVYHDRARYTFAPPAGGSTNTRCYVFDYRQGGYTRWTLPVGVTSAVAISPPGAARRLLLAGTDGMLYQVGGADSGDKASTGDSATAIAFSITGRAMGQEDAGEGYFSQLIPSRFWVEVSAGQATTFTWSVTGSVPGAASTGTYAVSTGDTNIPVRLSTGTRGRNLTPALSASVTKRCRIRSWLIRGAQGSSRKA